MATTVCANCGTEVDDEAIFCPTCGQPIQAASEPQLPPAPDWPTPPPHEPEPSGADATVPTETAALDAQAGWAPQVAANPPPEPPGSLDAPAHDATPLEEPPAEPPPAVPPSDVPPWRRGVVFTPTPARSSAPSTPGDVRSGWDEPEASEAYAPAPPAAPPPAGPPPAAAQPAAAAAERTAPRRPSRGFDTGFRPSPTVVVPETVSGWLATIGAAVGVLALFLPWRQTLSYTASWGLATGINVVFGILLLALLVALLLPHLVPDIPRRNLWLAAIGLVGVGIGLDRFGLPLTGMGATVFLIAMLLVAGGGLLAELGFDRRTGGPQT
jgi:hypothetical protein